MRIAQVVPPWLPVPPKGYGGIEAVVSELTEGLVARGHEVTLFATGDSTTKAKLSFVFAKALGNDGSLKNNPYTQLFQIYPAFVRAGEFDIIHIHGAGQAMFLADLIKTPVVHTIHGTLTTGEQNPDKRKVYQMFAKQNFVSISNNQREGLPQLNYVATVYNGIDLSQFPAGDLTAGEPSGGGGYVAWLGRITPKKGVVEAIQSAKAVGIPLRLAAFVDPVDQPFFDSDIKPLIDGSSVQFVGQLNYQDRSLFLQKAKAFLFPIKWQEPFGLVMVEAMAAGTPVVAFNRGSVPEIVIDGAVGFTVPPEGGVEALTAALKKLVSLDPASYQAMRHACRKHVEDHFTVDKMVDGYEAVYRTLTSRP